MSEADILIELMKVLALHPVFWLIKSDAHNITTSPQSNDAFYNHRLFAQSEFELFLHLAMQLHWYNIVILSFVLIIFSSIIPSQEKSLFVLFAAIVFVRIKARAETSSDKWGPIPLVHYLQSTSNNDNNK